MWKKGVEEIGKEREINGVDMKVKIEGVLKKIKLKENKEVKKGDIIMKMEESIKREEIEEEEDEEVIEKKNLKREDKLSKRGVGEV